MDKDTLLRADFYSWILTRYCLPNKTPYSFAGYEYLEFLAKLKWIPEMQVYTRKSSQAGWSELMLALLLWMTDRNLPNWKGSGLVFPATMQLQDHLKARFFPILEMPYFNQKLKNANLRYVRWNNQSINFRGGQTRRDLIGWPADFVGLDEFDEFMDPITIIPTIEARQNASQYKWIFGGSTPTYPEIGIDRAFSMSAQHHWYVPCQSCGKKYSPLIEVIQNSFENCVVKAPLTGNVGFLCPNCHELTQPNGVSGQWVKETDPKNNRLGFSVSRLFVKNASLGQLYNKFEEALNIQEFYNSDLGLPYAPANARLSRQQIEEVSIGASEMPRGSSEATYIGVDVGRKCHWMVGKVRENGYKEVIAYGICTFDEIEDIERRFNVVSGVYDLRPYEHEVKKLMGGRRGRYACDFNTGNQQSWYTFVTADDETKGARARIIKADRTQSCDTVIHEIGVKKRIILPSLVKGDVKFQSQMIAPIRMDVKEQKTGDIKATYNSGGKADHFFFAMIYLLLAFECKRSFIASLGPKIF